MWQTTKKHGGYPYINTNSNMQLNETQDGLFLRDYAIEKKN